MEFFRRLFLSSNLTQRSFERRIHSSMAVQSTVFMKRQARLDPEIAAQREKRKRSKLEKQIRELKMYSKKPKPIEELRIDIFSAKNLEERRRESVQLSEEELDQRKMILKEYNRSRLKLMKTDDRWLREAKDRQERALVVLKAISPRLYEQAIQPDPKFVQGIEFEGPPLSPPISGYECPDGDYVDTTDDFMREAEIDIFDLKNKKKVIKRTR